jgi:hypothetical protein
MSEDSKYLVRHRAELAERATSLLHICSVKVEQLSEVKRQIAAAFLFGMAYVYGIEQKLAPPEVQALVITLLEDIFGYNAEQAGAFSTRLVEASRNGPNDTMKAIIHRGIDGYRQLQNREDAQLRGNLLGLFETLGVPRM